MNITDALLGEHAVFYAQFDYLESSVPEATCPGAIKAHGAMLAAALASHAHIEEELLFTSVEPHIGSGGPLAVMRAEHDEIERRLESLASVEDVDDAKSQVLRIIALAREHFAKEEQVLFGMALQALTADRLSSLGAEWAERRAVALG